MYDLLKLQDEYISGSDFCIVKSNPVDRNIFTRGRIFMEALENGMQCYKKRHLVSNEKKLNISMKKNV